MKSLKIEWALTNFCNFKCDYCPTYLRDNSLPCPPVEKLLIACSNIADQAHKFNFDDTEIHLNGGEPSACEPLRKLLNSNLDSKIKFKLISNGSAEIGWWSLIRDNVSAVDLTYHLECDFNHFQSVVQILLMLGKKLYIKVPMPVEQDKWLHAYMAFKNLKKICKDVTMLMLYKNLSKGSNVFLNYTTAQWHLYYKIKEIEYEDELPEGTEEFKKVNKLNDFYGTICWAGSEQAVITYFGDVFRGWCMSNAPLGNVFNNTFELNPGPLPCPKVQCGNGFDRLAKKSVKSWGMT